MLDKSIQNFLYALGNGIAHEAKKVAPYVTGNLKKDIKVYLNFYQNAIEVGNSTIAPYAKFVFYGTKPHTIKRKTKKGKTIKIRHSGTKANPSLEKGMDNYVRNGGFDEAVEKAHFEEDVLKEFGLTYRQLGEVIGYSEGAIKTSVSTNKISEPM